ncbi:putative lactonohydrolase [Pyrenophora seminiperda CCB06]|uniref:Putative lactonohydrolase n=1 Tax=Pyrenophora seminiperda CCB06 TaxID=1302712 RepID=A0A3M7M5N4_9PLEO|nr:putative lactonohydrolase [Pyrenophora seminiperda CCB06]
MPPRSIMPSSTTLLVVSAAVAQALVQKVPAAAQVVNQKSFNVLDNVPPPTVQNATTLFYWPGATEESLQAKPFLVFDDEFYDVIGPNPSLTTIATSESDPIFHEAVTWYPPTDEVFFVQNAGPPAAGTGLKKSAIIQKILLSDAEKVRNGSIKAAPVTVVPTKNPQVINPNGGVNYKGNIIFAGEGQGDFVPSALYVMNPLPPYNTTTLVNNYFGRQFNSLNDLAVHPKNGDLYFTDTLYGYLQDFRPYPGIREQVYRYNFKTGALTVATDGFRHPNGIAFAPNGNKAYVTDTGIADGFFGYNLTQPASIYSFDVCAQGTFSNRQTFAFVPTGIPDGVKVDSKGRVYTGAGDGVWVYNANAKLIGKIYTGKTAANFQLTGNGRMIITGQTKLYYVTMSANNQAVQ